MGSLVLLIATVLLVAYCMPLAAADEEYEGSGDVDVGELGDTRDEDGAGNEGSGDTEGSGTEEAGSGEGWLQVKGSQAWSHQGLEGSLPVHWCQDLCLNHTSHEIKLDPQIHQHLLVTAAEKMIHVEGEL
ncbi:uncharacterized protein LOC126412641 [Schistocerca serialis cubense]|uniref:uncharacterized protein LOC126412641 n=1 Tax=Schistocerca serialis cubense TaxID=2023355 RepID=UPI00214E61E6|nr:uncharacterized protein LOC126412641 [Schistocerca serialis cubense]